MPLDRTHQPWPPPARVAAVVGALILLTGCSSAVGTPADAEGARAALAGVPAPGAGWESGGRELRAMPGPVLERTGDGTVWTTQEPERDATYVVTWQTPVPPGTEQRQCAEAARWLMALTERHLPGKVDEDTVVDDASSTRAEVTAGCRKAAARSVDGTSIVATFGSGESITRGGYQFGGNLTIYGNAERRILTATATASAQSSG